MGEIGEEARPETGSEDIVLLIEGVETEPESDSAVASAAVVEAVAEDVAEDVAEAVAEDVAETFAELPSGNCTESPAESCAELQADHCDETHTDHIDAAPADYSEETPAAMSSAEACSGTADVLASKAETVQEPESAIDTPAGGSRFWKIFRIIVVSLVIIAILALAAFIILSRVAPDFIDTILYSPEELEIIRHMSSS